jgi:hypothetical protein
VEDGTAFCPNCGAPQIRVSGLPPRSGDTGVADSETANRPVTPRLDPGTPGEVQPPAEPVPLGARDYHLDMPPRIEWSRVFPAASLAGFLLALCWLFPFASVFLLMVAAGGFTVALYVHRTHTPLTRALGARVGAMGGLAGFLIVAIMVGAQMAAGGGRFARMVQQILQQQIAANPDPRAQEMMQRFMTPSGIALLVTVVMVLFLIMVVVCSAIGGAVSAAMFRRGDRR